MTFEEIKNHDAYGTALNVDISSIQYILGYSQTALNGDIDSIQSIYPWLRQNSYSLNVCQYKLPQSLDDSKKNKSLCYLDFFSPFSPNGRITHLLQQN